MNISDSIGLYQDKNRREEQEDYLQGATLLKKDTAAPLHVTADQAEKFLASSVARIAKHTRNRHDGSTFTGAIINSNGDITTAQLGDSFAAVIIYYPQTHEARIEKLTQEQYAGQTPLVFDDGNIIQRNGYLVKNPGKKEDVLRVTRSFGDRAFGSTVSKSPHIYTSSLAQHLEKQKTDNRRIFLVVGTDGANPEEDTTVLPMHPRRIACALREKPDTSMQHLAHELVKGCLDGRSGDNVSIAMTEVTPDHPKILAAFDGHLGKRTSRQASTEFATHINLVQQHGIDKATAIIGPVEHVNLPSGGVQSIAHRDISMSHPLPAPPSYSGTGVRVVNQNSPSFGERRK